MGKWSQKEIDTLQNNMTEYLKVLDMLLATFLTIKIVQLVK